jgi:hypothetical protein
VAAVAADMKRRVESMLEILMVKAVVACSNRERTFNEERRLIPPSHYISCSTLLRSIATASIAPGSFRITSVTLGATCIEQRS